MFTTIASVFSFLSFKYHSFFLIYIQQYDSMYFSLSRASGPCGMVVSVVINKQWEIVWARVHVYEHMGTWWLGRPKFDGRCLPQHVLKVELLTEPGALWFCSRDPVVWTSTPPELQIQGLTKYVGSKNQTHVLMLVGQAFNRSIHLPLFFSHLGCAHIIVVLKVRNRLKVLKR